MKMNLTPGISTHFQILSIERYAPVDLTIGNIYKIDRWQETAFFFKDNSGYQRGWLEKYVNVRDVSFHINLEKILEE